MELVDKLRKLTSKGIEKKQQSNIKMIKDHLYSIASKGNTNADIANCFIDDAVLSYFMINEVRIEKKENVTNFNWEK